VKGSRVHDHAAFICVLQLAMLLCNLTAPPKISRRHKQMDANGPPADHATTSQKIPHPTVLYVHCVLRTVTHIECWAPTHPLEISAHHIAAIKVSTANLSPQRTSTSARPRIYHHFSSGSMLFKHYSEIFRTWPRECSASPPGRVTETLLAQCSKVTSIAATITLP
jgi:hypothetical protein